MVAASPACRILQRYHGWKLAEIAERLHRSEETVKSHVRSILAKLQATIPVVQERVDIRKTLVDKALASKIVYLSEFQELIGLQQDLILQQSRLHEADAAIAARRSRAFKIA